MVPMISVQEAQNRIISNFKRLEGMSIPLDVALGRILSEPIYSNSDLPAFDNSSVDGFAVQADDISLATENNPVTLKVIADIPAGSSPKIVLKNGQTARIMTGAPIPTGANAVVMVEDTQSHQIAVGSTAPDAVTLTKDIAIGENIRRIGLDITFQQKILNDGRMLRAQDIGILAMLGYSTVRVSRKTKIALISTGDELVPLTLPLTPGKIYDSNTYMLAALAEKAGCEVSNIGTAADRYDAVDKLLSQAAKTKPDLIISSAGVSAGAFDYVKDVVGSSGSINFWKVNMRPGKPLAFGSYRNIPFLGLPGNPVSSFVSFLVFVQPVLELLSGVTTKENPQVKVTLSESIESDGRESYLRAVIRKENGKLFATLTGHQGSGNLISLVRANALLIIPSGVKFCPPGTEVDAWILEN